MSKSPLVKIGVPANQAANLRQSRRVRQILDEGDAAIARIQASTMERVRVAVAIGAGGDDAAPLEEPAPAAEEVRAH